MIDHIWSIPHIHMISYMIVHILYDHIIYHCWHMISYMITHTCIWLIIQYMIYVWFMYVIVHIWLGPYMIVRILLYSSTNIPYMIVRIWSIRIWLTTYDHTWFRIWCSYVNMVNVHIRFYYLWDVYIGIPTHVLLYHNTYCTCNTWNLKFELMFTSDFDDFKHIRIFPHIFDIFVLIHSSLCVWACVCVITIILTKFWVLLFQKIEW